MDMSFVFFTKIEISANELAFNIILTPKLQRIIKQQSGKLNRISDYSKI